MKKEEQGFQFPSKFTIILFCIYLALTLTFFYLLGQKTARGFGLLEIIFSFGISLVVTFLIAWIRGREERNPYLGMILGVVAVFASLYAIFQRYQGPYTLTFATIAALITVGYFVFYFFKYRKEQA